MSNSKTMELAKWAVSYAMKNGADDVSVDTSKQRSVDVQFRDRKMDQLNESTQYSLSLSIYAKGKYSSHSTNDLRKDDLGKFIDEAIAMTKYLSEDEHRRLPDPKYYEGRKNIDLNIYDPYYESVTSEQRVKTARDIEDHILGLSDKIITCTSYAGDSYAESVKVHSNGFEGERKSSSFYSGVEATIDDGNGGRPNDWDYISTRFHRDLPSIESHGKAAIDRVLAKIGQAKMKSGVYDMVVENRAANRLISPLYNPMQARLIQRKNSFLEGKLGEKIASDKVTLIDDPFIVSGLGSRLYDGEGMTTKKRVMIDKGVLKSYYVDCYYGNKLGWEPTISSSTNMVIEPGNKSMDELVKSVKKGILVTSFIGGNSNSTTGDFSTGIIGLYIEDGKIVKPVNEMNVSGNLTEFWNQLAEFGNDPYLSSSWRRPSMYFKDIQFSGI
jgi:PmbA protein